MSASSVPDYTGLSAALELAKAGYKVVVLEAETVGYGASGRNGGQICTGFSPGQRQDRSPARQGGCGQVLRDRAKRPKQLIIDRIDEYKIDCDLTWGYLHASPRRIRFDRSPGLEGGMGCARLYRHADPDQGRARGQARHAASITARLREGGAGHFHPLNYCLGLARAAIAAGASIYENSPVIDVDTGTAPWARTADGKVTRQVSW